MADEVGAEAIAEIRGRREKLNTYQWAVEGDKHGIDWNIHANYQDGSGTKKGVIAEGLAKHDAEFIANAPTDIDNLLAAYDAVKSDVQAISASRTTAGTEITRLREQLAESERRYHLVLSQIWEALGVSEYNGKHVVEHVSELRARLAEVETLNRDLVAQLELLDDPQGLYTEARANLRAVVLNEAIVKVGTIEIEPNFSGHWKNGYYQAKREAMEAMETLRGEQPNDTVTLD